jgi:tetratricopeptide (TPR) repeat protein
MAYAAKGLYREATSEYQEANKLGNEGYDVQVHHGVAYAKMGERERAQAILKQLQTSGKYVSPAQLAILYAALDEREKAFGSLEKAYAVRDPELKYVRIDPALDSLCSDARVVDLVRRVGLAS